MISPIYLLDTNVLGGLTQSQRSAQFLRQHCVLSAEVAHELRGLVTEIHGIPVRDVTIPILDQLKTVMRAVDPSDTSLVDLYLNKGAANPVLIATALVMMDEEAEKLIQRKITIVTNDKAVARMAETFNIDHIDSPTFISRLS